MFGFMSMRVLSPWHPLPNFSLVSMQMWQTQNFHLPTTLGPCSDLPVCPDITAWCANLRVGCVWDMSLIGGPGSPFETFWHLNPMLTYFGMTQVHTLNETWRGIGIAKSQDYPVRHIKPCSDTLHFCKILEVADLSLSLPGWVCFQLATFTKSGRKVAKNFFRLKSGDSPLDFDFYLVGKQPF